MTPFVRIVVLNYDGGDMTMRCIESLEGLDWPEDRLEIVLVDNASIDGLVWKIPRTHPQIRVIESLVNEGFARGNNLAMADLDGVDFVALVNNDAFVEPNWLREMLSGFDNDRVGATCSKMLFDRQFAGFQVTPDNGSVEIVEVTIGGDDITSQMLVSENVRSDGAPRPTLSTEGRGSLYIPLNNSESLPTFTVRIRADQPVRASIKTSFLDIVVDVDQTELTLEIPCNGPERVINNAGGGIFDGLHGGDIGFKELDLGQFDTASEPFSFCGGAVVFRSQFLKDVGLFDASFFLYYEDLDLAWRGRFKGWTYKYVPGARVFHAHAYSSGEWSPFFMFWVDRNRRLTLVKNAPFAIALKTTAGAAVWMLRDSLMALLRSLAGRRRPDWSFIGYRLRQGLSFFKALPSAVVQRLAIGRSKVQPRAFVYAWISRR